MRQHLKNVYGTLMMTCGAASAGVYIDMYTRFQAGLLSAIVGAGLMLMLIATPDNGKNTQLRLGYLLGFGLTSGEFYLTLYFIFSRILLLHSLFSSHLYNFFWYWLLWVIGHTLEKIVLGLIEI